MPPILFDPRQRALRRQRAQTIGPSFLIDHALSDARERLKLVTGPTHAVLVIGPPELGHDAELPALAVSSFDAALVAGALETINDLLALFASLRGVLRPGRPVIGTLIGGDSFPVLRRALLEADRALGRPAGPRAHPRIDAPTLTALLQHAGFAQPVVDVERTAIAYRSFDRLVGDLRAAALTNQLDQRPRSWPGRQWPAALDAAFMAGADPAGRVEESVEWLHFIGWSPPAK